MFVFQDAEYIHRSWGLLAKSTHPEGFEFKVQIDPVILNVDLSKGASLIVFSTIAKKFKETLTDRIWNTSIEKSNIVLEKEKAETVSQVNASKKTLKHDALLESDKNRGTLEEKFLNNENSES